MYLWRAGEIITADKLTPRILSGAELLELTEAVGGYFRGSTTVTFPEGYFRHAPQVILTGRSSVPGVLREVAYQEKSVGGFTLHIARDTTTATWVDWVAIEVPDF